MPYIRSGFKKQRNFPVAYEKLLTKVFDWKSYFHQHILPVFLTMFTIMFLKTD